MSQLQVTGETKIRDIQGPVVANSGVITALDGAANQYVRGDGTLASFPTSGGGGSSVSYYLNGSVNQGTFGGSTYYQMSKNAIVGTGTNFSTSANGLIAQFITDANDPDVVSIPSGNWNVEFFMSVSASSGSLASFYVEIYKYNGSTFTLLATNVATPEQLTNTTTVDAYFTSVAMPLSSMAITDRLAIRVFANVASKTVTLYTEDNRLCQVVTTFSKGMLSMNNLTDQSQYLTTGTSGTNFAIVSSGDTHTFNLPVASATNTGKLTSTDWSTFNGKVPYTGATTDVNLGNYGLQSGYFLYVNGNSSEGGFLGFKQYPSTSAGTLGYTSISAYGKTNMTFVFADTGSNVRQFTLDVSTLTLSVPRTYSMPNLSGTLALLEGTQTFSGSKTFTENPIINGTGTNSAYTILQSAGTNKWRIGNNYAAGVNTFDIFAYDNTTTPLSINSNGAMTLSANVTTTGAQFVQNGFYLTNANGGALAGYTHMWGRNEGINFGLRNGTGGASFIFQSATSYEYTFPAATGTLALTSNLSAYLPLTGGTLTGALSGTSASFSNNGLFGGSTNAGNAGAFTLSVGVPGTTAGGIQLWAATNQSSFLQFGDSTTAADNYRGYIGYNHATDTLSLGTASADRLTIASNGAATFSSSVTAKGFLYLGEAAVENGVINSPEGIYINADSDNSGGANDIVFGKGRTSTSGGTTFMTIKNGGNVGIGTSSPVTFGTRNLDVNAGSGGSAYIVARANNNTETVELAMDGGSGYLSTKSAHPLIFRTTDVERMRITSGGNVLIGTTTDSGARINARFASSGNPTISATNTNASNSRCYYGQKASGSTDDYYMIFDNAVDNKFLFYGNGGLGNVQGNNVNISDVRTKKEIFPLESYWDKIKAIEIVKFKYKDQTHDDFNIGVIAQQVEAVAPEFIEAEDWGKDTPTQTEEPLKSVYTTDLYHATIKVLQEAMAKIEQLEEKVKQLENK